MLCCDGNMVVVFIQDVRGWIWDFITVEILRGPGYGVFTNKAKATSPDKSRWFVSDLFFIILKYWAALEQARLSLLWAYIFVNLLSQYNRWTGGSCVLTKRQWLVSRLKKFRVRRVNWQQTKYPNPYSLEIVHKTAAALFFIFFRNSMDHMRVPWWFIPTTLCPCPPLINHRTLKLWFAVDGRLGLGDMGKK